MSNPARVVIVGAGHAGGRVALELRANGFRGEIVAVGEELESPYERPPLSKEFLVTTGRERHAPLAPQESWHTADIDLRLGVRAIRLRPTEHALDLSDGTSVDYDRVVVATGAAPRVLRVPGAGLPGILPLRTVADATALRAGLGVARRIAIVGGGVIGLEVAATARQKGVQVDIIEAADRLMARVAPPLLSSWIAAAHESRGVRLHFTSTVTGFEPVAPRGVRLDILTSGARSRSLEVDLVVVAIGVSPCVDWLVGSGLELADGLVVDSHCRVAGHADCYAVGDVASTWSPQYGRYLRQETWRNAENQARAVARIICGGVEPFTEMPWMWSDQYDLNVQILGLVDTAQEYTTQGEPQSGRFALLGTRNGRLVSAALVNSARERRRLETLIASGGELESLTA